LANIQFLQLLVHHIKEAALRVVWPRQRRIDIPFPHLKFNEDLVLPERIHKESQSQGLHQRRSNKPLWL
jgi:hypothetical protein